MSHVNFALTLLFGVAIGALAVAGSRSAEVPPGVLPSLTAIAVGWWINYAIRRQAELERVPLNYISELTKQIDSLVSTCLKIHLSKPEMAIPQLMLLPQARAQEEGMVKLRQLANELHLLTTLLKGLGDSRSLRDNLEASYIEFKTHLTGEEEPDVVAASKASHRIRIVVLELHRHICRQILDHDGRGPVFHF